MNLFEGLKVIDLTSNLAGPCTGMLLGDYGAEVIHIEKPVYGDDNRSYYPMLDGASITYSMYNRNKRSVVLDLKDPRKVLGICRRPLLAPEAWYETEEGFRTNVIFPTAAVLEDDGTVKIWYGASDTVTALATAKVDDLIAECLKES